MKIVYTGPMRLGSLTESRRVSLIELGHEVVTVDQVPYLDKRSYWSRKMHHHLTFGPGVRAYNRELLRAVQGVKPDLVYIDQGQYLWPKTVAAMKPASKRIVHYTSEHFGFRPYLYRHFRKTISLYDAHVHSFQFSRQWLLEQGAKRVIKAEFGYDPALHRPVSLSNEGRAKVESDVIFIGHYEPETARMIQALSSSGVSVQIHGPGWRRNARRICKDLQIRPAVYGEEYVRLLAAAKICLCFLSKWANNTTHSASRTFEIPAIGSFLLAERTPDHLSYYVEGKEAEFFSSAEELIEKTKYYLANEARRKQIAAAGQRRCLSSGYTQRDRL